MAGSSGGVGMEGGTADGCVLSHRHTVVKRRGCVRRSTARSPSVPLHPSSGPAATEAEVKNRGGLVMLHVEAPSVLGVEGRYTL